MEKDSFEQPRAVMTTMVRDFKELRVYAEAFELAMEVAKWTSNWPAAERFALADQVRRSSRSVCANIAEAWFKRAYPRHFASKLTDASSEAAETIVHLDFADALGYLDASVVADLSNRYRRVIGGLIRMSADAHAWCNIPPQIGEPVALYEASHPHIHTYTP